MEHRLARLEAENDRLRDRVEALEDALFGAADDPLPIEWGLTPSEARIFRALCSRPQCSKDYLLIAISDTNGDAAEIKIIDVHICQIRKKLAKYEINIATLRGQGYALNAATREAYKAKVHT